MYIEFEKLPANARTWVYQANRPLTEEENIFIEQKTKAFLSEWTAHNISLMASCKVAENTFLIICVDEGVTNASGCSVDALFRFISLLEQETQTSFLDRLLVAYERDGAIHTVHAGKIGELIEQKIITENTMVYNNVITQKYELEKNWKVSASSSWINRYFTGNKETIVST